MRTLTIFAVFVAIFLTSSLMIPHPLFPGNVMCIVLEIREVTSILLMSGLVNGLFYGFVAWVLFKLGHKSVERALSKGAVTDKES
jgi:hypothetical protein